jgi:hypothetical protein
MAILNLELFPLDMELVGETVKLAGGSALARGTLGRGGRLLRASFGGRGLATALTLHETSPGCPTTARDALPAVKGRKASARPQEGRWRIRGGGVFHCLLRHNANRRGAGSAIKGAAHFQVKERDDWFAEEAGDVDEDVLVQRGDFGGVLLKIAEVGARRMQKPGLRILDKNDPSRCIRPESKFWRTHEKIHMYNASDLFTFACGCGDAGISQAGCSDG